jgi:allantoicase
MAPDTRDRLERTVLGPHEAGEPLSATVDLASRWVGGSVIAASDESFGDKENLLKPGPPDFEPGHYGNRGEIVDGWETKRRREPGHDWAMVRLGTPGIITSIEVDTRFFTGNYPEFCTVEACGMEGYPSPAELSNPSTEWVEIVPWSPLRGDMQNTLPVSEHRRFTHVRLSTFPDGGVARLRVFGRVVADPRQLDGLTIDHISQEYGLAVTMSSDGFYTSAQMLNRPDRARIMGEGWETRRRRDAGHDFVEFRLAFRGYVRQLIIDTAHFKYNASAEVAVYGCADEQPPSAESGAWLALLARTRLQADTRHVFSVSQPQSVASLRLDAFPDGGLSRVRVIGYLDPVARRLAGFNWFNALPVNQAMQCLAEMGMARDAAVGIVNERPLCEAWLDKLRQGPDRQDTCEAENAHLDELALVLKGAAAESGT